MRKITLNGPLSQFGCVNGDRHVGLWTLVRDNVWRAPVWVRKGPEGYRNLYNDEVAFVSLAGFSAYAPDGLTEESGHVWGENKRTIEGDEEIERLKREMDATLISFGWIVDDAHPNVLMPLSKTFLQRIRDWLRW